MDFLVEEPVALRDQMRVLGAVAPAQVRSRLAEAVALAAAEALGALMSETREVDLEAVCIGYQRELWLWLIGERTWAQCRSGLFGRLSRRTRQVAAP